MKVTHPCSRLALLGVIAPSCGRPSPPGQAVVNGWRRDERPRDTPQSLPRPLVSSSKPTTTCPGRMACRPRTPRLAPSGCPQSRAAPPPRVSWVSTRARRKRESADQAIPGHASSACLLSLLAGLCGFRETLHQPVFHAVTASLDGDHLRVVQQAVQQGARQDLIAQQRSPFGEAGITG
jgi:hypothetical protein